MPKFSIGQKVFNLDGVSAEVADIVDADDYALYSLRYADGSVGAPCWEDHELTPAKECTVCNKTGQGYTGQFFYLDCWYCGGLGYVHDQAPGQ